MNQPMLENLLPSCGLNPLCSPDFEDTPCPPGGPAALEKNVSDLDSPIASDGRAVRNRRERERKKRRRAENRLIMALEEAKACPCLRQELPKAKLHSQIWRTGGCYDPSQPAKENALVPQEVGAIGASCETTLDSMVIGAGGGA